MSDTFDMINSVAPPILVKECVSPIANTAPVSTALDMSEDFKLPEQEINLGKVESLSIISADMSTANRNFINSDNEDQKDSETSLEYEKWANEEKSNKRNTLMMSIIRNEPIELSWRKGLIQTSIIILVGISSTIPLTLIPAHDLLKFPGYWYETLWHGGYIITWFWVYLCYCVSHWMNIGFITSKRNILFMVIIVNVGHLFLLTSSYYIWTNTFSYNFPIPFLGMNLLMFANYTFYPITWFRFPKTWRKKQEFKSRMKFVILIVICLFFAMMIWSMIILSIRKSQWQPIIVAMMPISREAFLWIFSKLTEKTASGDIGGANIALACAFTANYLVLAFTIIGSVTTETTSWVLMGMDFSMNVGHCLRIVWMKKRQPEISQNQLVLIQDLAALELVEFYMPLSFLFVTALSYFGPNGHLIVNILSSYWTSVPIENIQLTLTNMAIFFFVDVASILITAIIFWIFCRINYFKLFLLLQQEFFVVFCVIQGYTLSSVSSYFGKDSIVISFLADI